MSAAKSRLRLDTLRLKKKTKKHTTEGETESHIRLFELTYKTAQLVVLHRHKED